MSVVIDDNDDVCFVFQDDEEAVHSVAKLKDVRVGERFIFRGEVFTKHSDLGWTLGICNIVDIKGEFSHIHPTTRINLLQ